ncbi:hypothetical protein COLO4_06849 [Corchorus olitorius]|uniref:Uncharacterized protein n=1 Tax=Corchorus olitorius TaxID=93759 RepID=A0A1R3KLY1_9ROSI|nr:hypothetical protein COLO4_06849 [Corchorus olitorius]
MSAAPSPMPINTTFKPSFTQLTLSRRLPKPSLLLPCSNRALFLSCKWISAADTSSHRISEQFLGESFFKVR